MDPALEEQKGANLKKQDQLEQELLYSIRFANFQPSHFTNLALLVISFWLLPNICSREVESTNISIEDWLSSFIHKLFIFFGKDKDKVISFIYIFPVDPSFSFSCHSHLSRSNILPGSKVVEYCDQGRR